jgi:hypothetical protein
LSVGKISLDQFHRVRYDRVEWSRLDQMARILGKRILAAILVGRETNGTGWRREMIELEERRSRKEDFLIP